MASRTVQQWERFIRESALASERVVFTRHAIERMRLRQIAVVAAVADDDPNVIVVTAMEL